MSDVVWFQSDVLTEKMQLAELLGVLGISMDTATEQQRFHARVLIQNLALCGVEFKTIKALLTNIVGSVALRLSPQDIVKIKLPITAIDVTV